MKIKGVNISVNVSAVREFFDRFKKKKPPVRRMPEVGERIYVNGIKFRIFDTDDESFKAVKDDYIQGTS